MHKAVKNILSDDGVVHPCVSVSLKIFDRKFIWLWIRHLHNIYKNVKYLWILYVLQHIQGSKTGIYNKKDQ